MLWYCALRSFCVDAMIVWILQVIQGCQRMLYSKFGFLDCCTMRDIFTSVWNSCLVMFSVDWKKCFCSAFLRCLALAHNISNSKLVQKGLTTRIGHTVQKAHNQGKLPQKEYKKIEEECYTKNTYQYNKDSTTIAHSLSQSLMKDFRCLQLTAFKNPNMKFALLCSNAHQTHHLHQSRIYLASLLFPLSLASTPYIFISSSTSKLCPMSTTSRSTYQFKISRHLNIPMVDRNEWQPT